VPPWRTFATIKLIEILVQARPKALRRALWHPDPTARHGMRWYARMGRRVWLYEVACFVFRDRRTKSGPSVSAFWGAPQDDQEESMAARRVARPAAAPRAADAA
jgi:anaerobic magnesium-protoporphyrin IX monomethyl ester cyclase